MNQPRQSLKPVEGANRSLRRRFDVRGELALATLPTGTVLIVLALVEALSDQRLLFASLASSAFLIYLDPLHGMNQVRTLVLAHVTAVAAGLVTFLVFGHTYAAGAGAMIATILLMIVLDAVHPPAVSTSLLFSLRAGAESEVVLFGLALSIVVVLVILQRAALWLLAHLSA